MEIHIGNRVADVSLVNKEGNKVQLTIDGKPYEVDIVMAENGSCSILHEGNSYNAELIQKESKKSYDVNIFYRSYRIDIVDTQAKYLRMKKVDDTRQDDKIIAPMPGKVLKILVQPGTAVTAGQLVLILEAMKMENEIYTTVAGTVQQLCCKEGDTVSTGDALIVVA